VRPADKKLVYDEDDIVWSAYGKDLVMFIPFNGEIKVKSICVIGGENGSAPSKMKLYKDVEAVDISILEDKKPLQVIDMNENLSGEVEYLLNITKFNNVTNIVVGFDENFGAPKTAVRYIGFKGEKLREKFKVVQTVYELQANLADHKTPGDKFANMSHLGY